MPKGPRRKEPPFRGIGREKLWKLGDPEEHLPISESEYQETLKTFLANLPPEKVPPEYLKKLPSERQIVEIFLTLGGDEVDDESFFVFIGGDAEWLSFPFAIDKIKGWQELLFSQNREESFRAQENLKRIGRVLAFKGWDKDGVDAKVVADRRDQVFKVLREKGIGNIRSWGHKTILLKEVFGSETIDRINILPRQNYKLADAITGALMGLSTETVRNKCKEAKKDR